MIDYYLTAKNPEGEDVLWHAGEYRSSKLAPPRWLNRAVRTAYHLPHMGYPRCPGAYSLLNFNSYCPPVSELYVWAEYGWNEFRSVLVGKLDLRAVMVELDEIHWGIRGIHAKRRQSVGSWMRPATAAEELRERELRQQELRVVAGVMQRVDLTVDGFAKAGWFVREMEL